MLKIKGTPPATQDHKENVKTSYPRPFILLFQTNCPSKNLSESLESYLRKIGRANNPQTNSEHLNKINRAASLLRINLDSISSSPISFEELIDHTDELIRVAQKIEPLFQGHPQNDHFFLAQYVKRICYLEKNGYEPTSFSYENLGRIDALYFAATEIENAHIDPKTILPFINETIPHRYFYQLSAIVKKIPKAHALSESKQTPIGDLTKNERKKLLKLSFQAYLYHLYTSSFDHEDAFCSLESFQRMTDYSPKLQLLIKNELTPFQFNRFSSWLPKEDFIQHFHEILPFFPFILKAFNLDRETFDVKLDLKKRQEVWEALYKAYKVDELFPDFSLGDFPGDKSDFLEILDQKYKEAGAIYEELKTNPFALGALDTFAALLPQGSARTTDQPPFISLAQDAPFAQKLFKTRYVKDIKREAATSYPPPYQIRDVHGFGGAAFAIEAVAKDTRLRSVNNPLIIFPSSTKLTLEASKAICPIETPALNHLPNHLQTLLKGLQSNIKHVVLAIPLGDISQQFLHDANPNVSLESYIEVETGLYKFGLFAKREIKPNEPLTINFGKDWAAKAKPELARNFYLTGVHAKVPFSFKPPKEFQQNELCVQMAKGSLEPLSKNSWLKNFLENTLRTKFKPIPTSFQKLLKTGFNGKLPPNLTYGQLDWGVGVFLKKQSSKIEEGELVGLYTGILRLWDVPQKKGSDYSFNIDTPEVTSKMRTDLIKKGYLHHSDATIDTQAEEINRIDIEVDAEEWGSFARYFNHASKLHANLRVEIYIHDGLPLICIVASKQIEPGQQMLICYGNGFWKAQNFAPLPLHPNSTF